MEDLRQYIGHLCSSDNCGNELELINMLQKLPPDATDCPMDVVKKLIKLIENYQGLRGQLTQMNTKVEKLGKSTGELEVKAKQWERAHQVVVKERDRLQTELNKMILCKDRLENLCRELQKEKKKIEDEYTTKLRLEQTRQGEWATKVNDSVNQLKTQIRTYQEQQQKLFDDNIQLTEKLQRALDLVKQQEVALQEYEKREAALKHIISTSDGDFKQIQQHYDSAIKNLEEAYKNEVKRVQDEYKKEADTMGSQVQELLSQRKDIEQSFSDQTKLYEQKMTQMSSLVTESQKTINKYKKEMGEITKFIKKLHDESQISKDTIHKLITDKADSDNKCDQSAKKLATLEALCRRLQSDRRTLVSMCKANGLDDEIQHQLAIQAVGDAVTSALGEAEASNVLSRSSPTPAKAATPPTARLPSPTLINGSANTEKGDPELPDFVFPSDNGNHEVNDCAAPPDESQCNCRCSPRPFNSGGVDATAQPGDVVGAFSTVMDGYIVDVVVAVDRQVMDKKSKTPTPPPVDVQEEASSHFSSSDGSASPASGTSPPTKEVTEPVAAAVVVNAN